MAMSGGVDSSVAAALLAEAGHEVCGVTLRLWGGDSDSGCCAVSDVEDARRVADRLGIEHHVFNDAEAFERHVVVPYVDAHAAGRTPNPCVECNRHLKFGLLAERAERLDFDAVATGHHARRVWRDGAWRLVRGADGAKDQSYVLHPLLAGGLDRVLLPIGELTKAEVRARAAELDLRTATKPESQDVCFVTRAEGRAAFLGRRIPLRPARAVDLDGVEVGEVAAVELVTVGQRRGVGLAGGTGRRFVLDVEPDGPGGPVVVVGDATELLVDETWVDDVVWAPGAAPADGAEVAVTAQCSAHGRPLAASAAVVAPGVVRVRWATPERRVAAGQSVVLYVGDEVAAGGTARRSASRSTAAGLAGESSTAVGASS